ncbi:Tim44 domain-containing protein [Magnetococcales bacterium HHB-1]
MRKNSVFSLFAIFLMLFFSAIIVWPEDADARRFGGGRSFGSRGSKSFSTTKTPTNRSGMVGRNNTRSSGGFGKGMLGGMLGGFLLGGLLGSLLFGGGGGFGGLLDILLIGGLIYFAYRYFRKKKAAKQGAPMAMAPGGMQQQNMHHREALPPEQGAGGGNQFATIDHGDDVSNNLEQIAASNPAFDEENFLQGACYAFEQIQHAWADWSVDKLRPLLTDRMWGMIQQQAKASQEAGERNVVEKIDFEQVDVSEAWQENGEDFITVRFLVQMIDLTLDLNGNLIEGDPDHPVAVEEYWTFTHPTGSQDPNWLLSAVQQPGEIARSTI